MAKTKPKKRKSISGCSACKRSPSAQAPKRTHETHTPPPPHTHLCTCACTHLSQCRHEFLALLGIHSAQSPADSPGRSARKPFSSIFLLSRLSFSCRVVELSRCRVIGLIVGSIVELLSNGKQGVGFGPQDGEGEVRLIISDRVIELSSCRVDCRM